MDKTALLDQDIDQGRRLVQALDQAGFPVVAAFWSFLPEEGDWRLLIASPKVAELGPRDAYATIREALRKMQIDLPLHRVSAVSPDEPMVVELRIFAGTDPAPYIGGTTLYGVVLGDLYVEDAYVYRAERIIGQTGTYDLVCAAPDKARKVWIARPCKITTENGFLTKIDTPGFDWPQTRARHGVNAHLGVLTKAEKREGKTFADVMRWSIHDGRLRRIETVAKGVPVEGLDMPAPQVNHGG
jgi:hypothetical protein